MKYINFLVIIVMVMFVMTSCEKESLTSTVDNTPEVEPTVEVVEENTTPSYASVVNNGSTALTTFVMDSTTMAVNNYSLVMPSSFVGGPGLVFSGAWFPSDPTETTLQEATYTDLGTVHSINQDGMDAHDAWEANGSDPDTFPYDEIFTEYSSDLSITVSNITATTADVAVSGNVTDTDGNVLPISGSFTADLY